MNASNKPKLIASTKMRVNWYPDRIIAMNPGALLTCGMGPRVIERFQEAVVAFFRAGVGNLDEVMGAYRNNKVGELTEGCRHVRH